MENKSKNSEKNLSDVFNELKEIRRKQAIQNNKQYASKNINNKNTIKKGPVKKANKENLARNESSKKKNIEKTVKKEKIKKTKEVTKSTEDFNYDIYQTYGKAEIIDHKFNAIGAILGILFFILFMTTIKSNYIFATSKEEEKRVIGTYEQNENPINLMECVSENISEITKKEIVTEDVIVEREVEYIENSQLPKNEQLVIDEGKDEYREVTYIRSYENGELIDEVIISDNLIQESSNSIIQVGTSEFLANNKVHIGDTMYTKEEVSFMTEPKNDANAIGTIHQYIDFKLQEVQDDWCKIIVDGIEGYVKSDLLTSAAINPDIVDKSRIKRIQLTLSFDMEINKPSGLSKEDFKKVLSNNINDIYKIFENNAELFYDIEQKYNINGVFIASIGIHESNWGTSNIAKDKKNLFGYGAYDSSPYTSSTTFESYEYGIEFLAKMLSKYYINVPGTLIYDGEIATGTYYNGSTISGVNVRYASDSNWANRVYEIMTGLYEKLDN